MNVPLSKSLGDCCGDDVNTDYCDDCSCLDPNYIPTTTSTTTAPPEVCKNKLKAKKCRKIKKRGKCNTNAAKKNCAKLCGHCS